MPLVLQELDEPLLCRWNEIVDRFEHATIFHTMEWLNVLNDVLDIDVKLLSIFEGDDIVGVFPVLFTKRMIFQICASPLSGWMTPYLGPLIDPERLKEVMAEFVGFLQRKGVDYSEIAFPDWVDPDLIEPSGFTCEKRTTYILDLLDDLEEIWKRFDGRCRTSIRKGIKSGLEVVDGDLGEEVDRYYDMLIDVYEKSNRLPPMPKKFYASIHSRLNDRLKFLFIRYNGQTIAGGIFLWYRETIYYFDGASDRRYLDLCPNNLLQWTLIQWASDNGLRVYDMIGADIPSIARFKASFGPQLVGYTYAHRSITKMASLGRMLYKKGAPFVRMLRRRIEGG